MLSISVRKEVIVLISFPTLFDIELVSNTNSSSTAFLRNAICQLMLLSNSVRKNVIIFFFFFLPLYQQNVKISHKFYHIAPDWQQFCWIEFP